MARTDGETWDLASGVGATATAVAASRALAHRSALIDDPWAEPLVKAVCMDMVLQILDGHADSDQSESDLQTMALGMAVRTRYFDDFLTEASRGGIRQAVILASGLDTRSYRLDWPEALRVNGFDPNQPAAWIAEGLLIYLPPEAQDRLFDHITALSPAGSRLATEFMPSMGAFTGMQYISATLH